MHYTQIRQRDCQNIYTNVLSFV